MSQELEDLARAVRSVVDREPDGAKLWPVLCEQVGVAALAVPERFGGVGAGVRELQVVAEELGRGLTPSPLLSSSVLATQALLSTGDDEACERLLPGLAEGATRATLAWDGLSTGGYVLDGVDADVLLVVAEVDGEPVLFEVEEFTAEPVESMDQTLRLAAVQQGHPGRRLGQPELDGVRDAGVAVLAAEQVGAAAQALAITVEYTKQRVQFGRPIGSFQALKHRMADLHVLVESARSAAYAAGAAGAAVDAGSTDAARAAITAKIHCSMAFSTVAAEMIQLHGGIGFTWEHDAHRYFKRAHATAQLFGQPREHLARLADLVRGTV